mgnify:CR=1 FL=1
MGERGRRAGKELSVVGGKTTRVLDRPSPPADLTDEQAREWVAIVENLPAEWFPRQTWGLLSQYCRHTVNARRVGMLIEQLCNPELEENEDPPPFDTEEYDRLLKMQEREGRALSSLATRMRISQQTFYDREKVKGPSRTKPPWEEET